MTDATLDRPGCRCLPAGHPAFDARHRLRTAMAGAAWMDRGLELRLADRTSGAIIVLAGMVTMSAGYRRALVRHGTNVNPSRPTTALVTDGVFGVPAIRSTSVSPSRCTRWR